MKDFSGLEKLGFRANRCHKLHHKNLSMIIIGFFGLSILLFALLYGNNLFGETAEKALTLLGSIIVASAHFKNLKVCKKLECNCHDEKI